MLVEGKQGDFNEINGRKVLLKPGAEKFTSLLSLTPVYLTDDDTRDQLPDFIKADGVICYRCELRNKAGQTVSHGKGSRQLRKDNGDVNKAQKMAMKSSLISAVIGLGLSQDFTQDIDEDHEGKHHTAPTGTKNPPPAPPQNNFKPPPINQSVPVEQEYSRIKRDFDQFLGSLQDLGWIAEPGKMSEDIQASFEGKADINTLNYITHHLRVTYENIPEDQKDEIPF